MNQSVSFTQSLQRLFVVLAISQMLIGCNVDETTNANANDVVKLVVELPQTRTAIGEKSGDIYPVYWSEGDRIAVNGVPSGEVKISANNRAVATFELDGVLKYPFSVTYPYSVATTAAGPIVEFQSEQNYVKGSFAEGSAPMCGYIAEPGDDVVLKHLAGVLKFSVKASGEGVALQKVTITSTSGAKLSGEFTVDCATTVIAPTERTHSTTTYLLPADFELSATQMSEFYIAIPAIEVGDCLIEFEEISGDKMKCEWSPSSAIKSGVIREFKQLTYERNTTHILEEAMLPPLDEVVESRVFKIRAMSYNVHNCRGTDGTLDYERVGNAIAALNVDVASIQELDSMTTRYPGQDVLKNIADYAGMHPTFGAAIDRYDGKYGVGILSKVEPLSYYRVPLPCSSEPRVMLVAEFEDYYFCATHFSLLAEYRAQAVDIIIEEAKKLDKPMIVAGDLNAVRTSEPIRLLSQHFDVFYKRSPVETFPSEAPTKEIDYICLYTDKGAIATVIDSWVPSIPIISDHRPTVVDAIICE